MDLRHLFSRPARGAVAPAPVRRRAATFAGLTLLLAIAAIVGMTVAPAAQAATCSAAAVTVTPMHSPDGTQRPFYSDDFGGGTSNHSGYVGYELSGASLGADVWIKLSGFSGGALGLAANQSAAIPVRATSQAGHALVYAYLTATALSSTAQTFTVEVWNGKPGQTGSTQVCARTDGFSAVTKVISASANKITSITVSNSSPAIGGSFDVSANGDTGTMGAGPTEDQVATNGVFSMAPAMSDTWPADAFTLTGTQVAFSSGSTYRDRLRVYPTLPAHTNSLTYTATYHFTVRNTTSAQTSVFPVQNIASGTQVKYTGTYPGTLAQISAPAVTTSLVKTAKSVTGPPYHVTYQVIASNSSTTTVMLDYLRDTPTPTGPANWTFDTGSAKLGGTAIADPVLDSGTLVFTGPFSIPGSGSLVFTYTLALTTTVTNSVVGAVGGVVLGASSGSGNAVSVDPSAPVVTTSVLPNATTGSSYSQTLTASGGTGSYTWTVTSGNLPAGLSLDGATGTISGTPAAAGTSTFTVTATDGTPASGSKSMTLGVDPAGGATPADTTAPSGSLALNGGASTATSNVLSVGLTATDDTGVVAYRVAEGLDCSAASWTSVSAAASFAATTTLALSSGDGGKSVCAEFKDTAGNVSTTASASITLDTSPPTLTLTSAAGATVTGAFTVVATFSENVSGFDASDVATGGGSITAFSGSGSSYSFTVTPSGDGTVTVDVAAAAAADAAGNSSEAATRLSRTADVTRPTVTLTTPAPSPTNTAFTVTATFSEAVSGFGLSDVIVGNGAASGLSGAGTTYSFTVTPTADGAVTIDVAGAAASDAAGNGSTAAGRLTRVYDATAAAVTLATTATDPVNGGFTVTATFTKPVTGFDAADVVAGNGSVSALSGSGASYSFTITPNGDGLVTVDLPAAAASDTAGNASTAATGLSRTADLTRPAVALASASADPTNSPFDVTATFSEPVSGFDASDIVARNGAVSRFAGSGSTYSFTVAPAGDGAVTIDVPADSAADAAGNGNNAALQLARRADVTRPSVSLASAGGSAVDGAFTVTAVFSEPVTGLGASRITVGNGTLSGLAGAGTTYTFTITPAADGALTVDVPAGGAHDAAGNGNTAAARLRLTYDSVAPSLAVTSGPAPSSPDGVAIFAFAADGAATFECSLDGAAFTACAAPYVASDLAAGDHVLTVRATDAAGNSGETAYRWTVTQPTVTLSQQADDSSNGSATFAWSSTAMDATFTCTLDEGPSAPCSSPYSVGDLEDGDHTLIVEAHAGVALTGSTTVRWSSHRRVPQPDVLIIPKINATDWLGRPRAFKQSVDAPHSLGPFTRKRQVELHIPSPSGSDVQVDSVFVSNYPDFRDEHAFPLAADELYDWELLDGPSGDRPVYIRFEDTPDAPVGRATIVLDQELPTLHPTRLSARAAAKSLTAIRSVAAHGTVYCGAARRRWLQLPATDGLSGLNAVQIASDPAHACAWRPYLPTISYRLPGSTVFVRIEDRVGNISAWYRVTAP